MSTNPWQTARDKQQAASGGIYLTLPSDGDSEIVVFAGPPHTQRTYWDESEGRSVVLGDDEQPPTGTRAKVQHKVCVYVPAINDMKILRMSASTFERVVDVVDEVGMADFVTTKIKIRRKGTGKLTEYVISSLGLLSAEERERMQSMDLIDVRQD